MAGEYPPMQGGVGAFTREVARAMVPLGAEVAVFTRHEVQSASGPGITVEPGVGRTWGWTTLPQMRTWAKAHQLDVINVQFQTAAYNMHPAIHFLPSAVNSVPVVVTFHDLRVPYLFPKAGPLRASMVRKLARDADGVIATDRADEATLREAWGLERVCWIPIGSNISTTPPAGYQRDQWRSERGILQDELLISYFGFLNESKGGIDLIQALAHLIGQGIPAKLVMIGGRAGSSDPTNVAYGQRVDELIAHHQLEDRILWTGFVADEQVSAHFYASDLTALPYRDGVSLRRGTLMAALAHGRAIVTTLPETDTPELDSAVTVVPPGDSQRLADAIAHLWSDAPHRQQLERAGLAAASHFTWDSIAKRTLHYFDALIGR